MTMFWMTVKCCVSSLIACSNRFKHGCLYLFFVIASHLIHCYELILPLAIPLLHFSLLTLGFRATPENWMKPQRQNEKLMVHFPYVNFIMVFICTGYTWKDWLLYVLHNFYISGHKKSKTTASYMKVRSSSVGGQCVHHYPSTLFQMMLNMPTIHLNNMTYMHKEIFNDPPQTSVPVFFLTA
jgi:hypothetical protein